MNYSFKQNGFTLVETLVAIAILMIAIAGPLTIANNALTAALGARNAMIATYLAQDGMETIKNIKDNIIASSLTKVNLSSSLGSTCSQPSPCQIPDEWGVVGGSPGNFSQSFISCQSSNPCLLYTNDTPGTYSYSLPTGGHASPFTRYFYFSNVAANDLVVTIVVKWTDSSVPSAITLQEILSNVPR